MPKNRMHEPVPIPAKWNGEERRAIIRINALLDEIYQRMAMDEDLQKLEERVQALEGQGNENP